MTHPCTFPGNILQKKFVTTIAFFFLELRKSDWPSHFMPKAWLGLFSFYLVHLTSTGISNWIIGFVSMLKMQKIIIGLLQATKIWRSTKAAENIETLLTSSDQ